jgi:Raf kinase inhibitor-like YbhB/YbcL family protein
VQLTSSAFSDGGAIPERYTRDGEDVSPPLAWSDVPRNAVSLALIVDDPDATTGSFTHWILVDLPPTSTGLAEGTTRVPGGRFGVNDWMHPYWNGPAPPTGRHRYIFKLYALDRALDMDLPSKRQVEASMAGHVVDETKLSGTYERSWQ